MKIRRDLIAASTRGKLLFPCEEKEEMKRSFKVYGQARVALGRR